MRGEEGGSSAITEADMQVFIASEQEDSNGTQQTAADGSEGDQQSQSLVCPVAGCNFLGKGNNPKGALDSHISSKHDQQHRRYREQQQRGGRPRYQLDDAIFDSFVSKLPDCMRSAEFQRTLRVCVCVCVCCVVLCCVVLCCAVLCCVVLCCVVFCLSCLGSIFGRFGGVLGRFGVSKGGLGRS